ncbi:patatin-like phospholipase family protein [Shigella flexneri]|nr:patatin-like phospholipase family protein [Shigella flexneri]
MSTEMKTGLVLSGGGAVGAYQAGVVKALAECDTQISMVSGASIGAFNGAIIAASPDLSEAAVRLEALWDHLGNNQVLSVNRLVYFSLLKKLFQAMNLCQIPGRAGALLTTLLRHISILNGFDNLMAQPLLSDEPLTALLDHYLDTDALADGLPLYVSLYPTEGGMQDIIDCIRAELGAGTTKNAVFQHIQSLPRGQQKEALLASAALPLLFRPREVQGTMFGDGGMGGWRNMQGNTPVTPLVDAGCNMVIVTHLSDGSLWDRQAFPDTTILEIRPRKRLKYAGDGDNSSGLLSFTLAHTDAWRQQGYEDTMLTMEHIRKPLAARQVLSRSETVLQKSLEITEEADLALRNAMARIK